jgi:general secretion pathway protein L
VLLRCIEPLHLVHIDGQALAPAAVPGTPCTVLLPASISSITELAVGKGEAALLRKTLPWRLEETVVKAPETLHFSHGALHEGRVAVTITEQSALAQIQATAAAAGFVLHSAHAELSLVPWQPQQWSLWLPGQNAQHVLVRHGWHQGFACQTSNLAAALTLLQNEQQAWPQQIVVFGSPAEAALVQPVLPAPLRQLLVVRRPPAWQELLAAADPEASVLQGAFAPPLPWRRWWQSWRIAACLLAALVLGDAAVTGFNTWQAQSARAAMQQQITALFRQVQPQGALVDPVAQLRQVLVQSGGPGQQLLPLLTRMAPVLRSEPGSVVQALDFDALSGSLQLELRSSGLSGVESLRSKLQKAGLAVELIGSQSDGQSSQARLRVGIL